MKKLKSFFLNRYNNNTNFSYGGKSDILGFSLQCFCNFFCNTSEGSEKSSDLQQQKTRDAFAWRSIFLLLITFQRSPPIPSAEIMIKEGMRLEPVIVFTSAILKM